MPSAGSASALPLADRVEAALADAGAVRRIAMFGGQCFMVRDKLAVGVFGARQGAGLLVRVDPDRGHELLDRPGVSISEMGAGRRMGPGWLRVKAFAVADEAELAFWIAEALAFNADTTRRGHPQRP